MIRRVAGNSLIYLVAMLLNRGLAFLLIPLYTRYLTPSQYGEVSICNTVISVVWMVLPMGLDIGIGLFYYKLPPEEYRKLLRVIWLWLLIAPALAMPIVSYFAPSLAAGLFPHVPSGALFLRLSIWIAYFSVGGSLASTIYRTEQRAAAFGVFTTVYFLVTSGLVIYFVAVRDMAVIGNLYGQLAAAILAAAASHAVVLRRCLPPGGTWLAWDHLRSSFRLGTPDVPHMLAIWILNVSDRWILGHFSSMAAVGIYSLAYSIGMIVQPIAVGIISAISPVYYEQSGTEGFDRQLPLLVALYVLAITWLSLSLAVVSPELIHVIAKPRYYGAVALVPWIAVSYWAYTSFYLLANTALVNARRTQWIVVISGPPAMINIALNWFLVPRYGPLAAAVDTLVALAAMGAISVVVARKWDRIPFSWAQIAKIAALSVAIYEVSVNGLRGYGLVLTLVLKGVVLLAGGVIMAGFSGIGPRQVARVFTRERLNPLQG